MKVTSKKYSTNNAWGFGGSYGTEYTFPSGWVLRVGTACFRHRASRPVRYAVSPEGGRYLDLQEKDGYERAVAQGVPAEVLKFKPRKAKK